MELTEHVQYIIHSAKTIVYARDYDAVEPEHIMLALFLDENDLPKIILEKLGLDNPRMIRDYNESIPRRENATPARYSEPPLSRNTVNLLETAEKEGLAYGDKVVSIEHLFLALFKSKVAKMEYIFGQYHINTRELYFKMKDIIDGMTTVDIVGGKAVERDNKNSGGKSDNNEKSKKEDENPLEKYTKDLTAIAAESRLDPVIGRDDEIRRVIQILNRRSKNNPVIVGEPGVGKTAVIEGLAQRIVKGDVPESLKNDKILSLDLGALLAGASYRGEFEERLKSVLGKIEEKADDLMLFIDEIHTIMGMGASEGSVDAGNLLKPMLARGTIRVIGATTLDEYKKYIEKDKALERRFQPVIVDEPSFETAVSILRGLKNKYEVFHGIKILDEALVQAVKLSQRYITDRYLPDKGNRAQRAYGRTFKRG